MGSPRERTGPIRAVTSMITAAFFISPEGDIVSVQTSHIAEIIKNPGRFGLSADHIYAEYRKCGERIGIEGKAREKIITALIKRGWIRIRHYPKDSTKTWRMNVGSLTPLIEKTLSGFGQKIISGICGYREQDLEAIVSINQADGTETMMTVAALQNFKPIQK